MSKILLIDNYDSFTYNLFHYLDDLWPPGVVVYRNDELSKIDLSRHDKVVISPGPGLPAQAGDLIPFLKKIYLTHQVLGVCLGLQAIAELFGLQLKNLDALVHGQAKTIRVLDRESLLFRGLPPQFKVARYHSWVIDEKSNAANTLNITSLDESNNIMSISHPTLPIHAVQFHPESVLCEYGKEILSNWLNN